jgi:hypothetical protein
MVGICDQAFNDRLGNRVVLATHSNRTLFSFVSVAIDLVGVYVIG